MLHKWQVVQSIAPRVATMTKTLYTTREGKPDQKSTQ